MNKYSKGYFYMCIVLNFSFFLSFINNISCQEYIQNGNFEIGTIPTGLEQVYFAQFWDNGCSYKIMPNLSTQAIFSSDLLDKRSSDPNIKIPNNLWGITFERTNLNRYVHFGRNIQSYPVSQTHLEKIRGDLIATLPKGEYLLTFYATAAGTQPWPNRSFPQSNFIEVVLYNGNNCNSEYLVYETATAADQFNNWKKFEKIIYIDDSKAGYYNKIGFKMKELNTNNILQSIHIDDISLKKIQCSEILTYADCYLSNYQSDNGKITYLKIKMTNLPVLNLNLGSWWNIYESNNCDMNDLDNYIDNPLRETHFGNEFIVNTPQTGKPDLVTSKCYIIKHGVWTNSCSWAEKRLKIKLETSISN